MENLTPLRIIRSAGLILLLTFCEVSLGQAKSETGCLSYEPAVVSLKGTLVRKTFPGPPNYESVSKGDAAETYWLLRLAQPICVDANTKEPDLGGPHTDLRLIQLVVKPQVYKNKAALVGKSVVASGTLFEAITGHHHTPVLLTVTTLAER